MLTWKWFFAVVLSAACEPASGQAPRVATLDIEWENAVVYANDLADPSKLATSTNPVAANIRNFMMFTGFGDIVSVNGKPAKGSWVDGGRLVQLVRSPAPGQAIGDVALRGGMVDIHLEILQSDGTTIGSIMTSGFTGGSAPPGLPGGLAFNLAVTAGTGAFEGVRGTLAAPTAVSFRTTSMAEDPANRRMNGGTSGHFFVYLIPTAWPDILTTASGPSVFHADFSPVTSATPARAGETLILTVTGLGPTRPGLIPGTPFPDSPAQEVNSPLEVTVNGKPADVLNKFGWPGTTNTYRLDIRVPDSTAPGNATFQITASFIAGREMKIPVQ